MSDKGETPARSSSSSAQEGGGGHHGGAWKVAYADFVTAMMAFFMVMWLVAAVDQEQRAAIFEYFKNPSMEAGQGVKGGAGPDGSRRRQHQRDQPAAAGLMRSQSIAPSDRRRQPGQGRGADPAAGGREEAARVADGRPAQGHRARARRCKPFKDQLLLDITPEGLRIQIVDAQNRPMFDLGSSHAQGLHRARSCTSWPRT